MNGVLASGRMPALILVLSLLAIGSGGQELPGRVAGTGQLSFNSGVNPFGTSSDVFVGNDAPGPYILNWKNINRFSESVSVDDRLMQRDSDYAIDYAAGTIRFASSVSSKAIIRVEYSYDPAKAVRNRAPLNMPLTLDIMKKQNRGLQFTALYRQPEAAANATPDVLVYGLTGSTKAKEGELNTMFLFSPDRDGETEKGKFDQRSAIKLGSSTKTDNLQLTTSFLHVGEQFAGSNDYKLQQGMDAMNLAAVFTPSKNLLMSSSFNRTENSVGEQKGQTLTTSEQKIVLTPDGAPKLTMVHSEVEKGIEGAASQATATDRIQLDQDLGSKVSAQAIHQTVNVNTGGSDSSVSTDELNIKAAPTKIMSLNVGIVRSDADTTGETNAESLKFVANPSQKLSINMSLAHRDTDAAGDELSHSLKIVSALRPDTKLEFGMSSLDVERPEDQSSRALKLSTTAIRNASVFVDLAEMESDVNGSEQFGGIRVETTPIKRIKLGGGLSQRETAAARDVNKEARLEVQPFDNTTIGGAYKETESNGQVVARVSEVTASTKPADFIQFAGAWKDRETLAADDPDSLNLSLMFDTGGLLKFTGAYTSNPEDKKGAVLRQNSQTLGVKTDFGRLKVKGAYTQNDLYLAGKRGDTRELGIDYRLSSYSLLTTGYSLDEQQEASLLQTSVYSLGYTHAIGSRLNLYLGGKMTTYERDRITMTDPEYEAEARLGLKF